MWLAHFIITNIFERNVRIPRLQRFQKVRNLYLGRWPRLSHFAPLALRPGVSTQSQTRGGTHDLYRIELSRDRHFLSQQHANGALPKSARLSSTLEFGIQTTSK